MLFESVFGEVSGERREFGDGASLFPRLPPRVQNRYLRSLLPCPRPSYTLNVCPPPTGNLPATASTDLQSFRRHLYDDDGDGPARG